MSRLKERKGRIETCLGFENKACPVNECPARKLPRGSCYIAHTRWPLMSHMHRPLRVDFISKAFCRCDLWPSTKPAVHL